MGQVRRSMVGSKAAIDKWNQLVRKNADNGYQERDQELLKRLRKDGMMASGSTGFSYQNVEEASIDDIRKLISEWFKTGKGGGFWDLITALRGPDYPSERPDMSAGEQSAAYSARRKRKYASTEVIRKKAFYGVIGGAARSHDDDHITLPPQSKWDHFDKHMARAAAVLGLEVRFEK